MRHLIRERGLTAELSCDSAAATTDALGMGVHPGTRRVLARHHIHCGDHRARLLTQGDLERYDIICGMDQENLYDMRRILGPRATHKVHLLLDWTDHPRDVADPWYTDDYDATFKDVWEGVSALLDALA